MKLILKNLKQVEYDIFIASGNITVKEFKKEIERLYSFDSEQIKLIFNGTVLENDKTLEQYQIKENNHIIIMNTKTKIIKNEDKPKPIEYQEKSDQIKPEIGPKDKPNISQILSDNWTIQVNSLVDMGFERSQVEAAVKAANGRIDLAVEYLNNGIPDNKVNNNNRNRNNNIQRQKNKDDITKELKKQAGVIKMLCKDNKLRIFEILNNIKSNDPGLMRLITDYRDDFKNYLDSPITEEDKQNYEKIEAEADKIQQERKEKKEKAKKEKEEKEKKEKEKEDKEKEKKEEKEEKEEKENENEKEKKEDKNEEKKEDEIDDKDKNKEEISKEEKKENENKTEEEKEKNEENKEDKEPNKPGENMEEKQEEKAYNKSNNTEPKKDDNMNIEEEKKNIEKNNNENKNEISEKIDEKEKKKEIAEEKKETDEDNKNKEKDIENKENKDKGQETANNKIEDNGNNQLINQLTEEEKEAVNRIKSLCDFSFQTVAEAYIACNKNEELTANFLFENM